MGTKAIGHRDRHVKRMRRFLLTILACASMGIHGGCVSWLLDTFEGGGFKVIRYENDGTMLLRGSKGRKHRVRLYGIRIKSGSQDPLKEFRKDEFYARTRVKLINGGTYIVEKGGKLVYGSELLSRSDDYSPNIVESDGKTPKKDEDGSVPAIVAYVSYPPFSVQRILLELGIAEPDPDISNDPYVDSLRRYERLLKRERSMKR
jgi:hypothetical protein